MQSTTEVKTSPMQFGYCIALDCKSDGKRNCGLKRTTFAMKSRYTCNQKSHETCPLPGTHWNGRMEAIYFSVEENIFLNAIAFRWSIRQHGTISHIMGFYLVIHWS